MTLRVLILGGYGTFGRRLTRLLADRKGLVLICAGRDPARARRFTDSMEGTTPVLPARIDRDGDLAGAIAEWQPDLIVDASGPFQDYGDDPYRVAQAAIAAGVCYLDLADAAAFVDGIWALDAEAKDRGVFAISGASTFPALSSAVVAELSAGWQSVEGLVHGLAPSPRAGLGRNVIEAIMSYAGKPVPVIEDGRLATATALVDARHFTVAPPGLLPLPRLRFALTDLPDQRLFPKAMPDLRSLWTGVGTRPQVFLRGLSCLALAVKWKLLKSLSPFAGAADWSMRHFRWGAHRGGLFLRLDGVDADGLRSWREWHMIAEGDDGPFIPAIAAASVIDGMLAGNRPDAGARSSVGEFTLDDFRAVFAAKRIAEGTRRPVDGAAPLYRRILGEAWDRLPSEIRALHEGPDGRTARGSASVERGNNPIARLIARLVGFPAPGTEVPVEVRFRLVEDGELWQRSFGGRDFSSIQRPGSGAFEYLLSERFGPLDFGLALVLEDERLWLKTVGWRAFGIPMPRFLAPSGDAFEHVEDGRFRFHVEIRHWLTGLIVRYRGWLE